jgi:hypothetical protein
MSFTDQPDPIQNLALATQPRPGERRAAGWQIVLTAAVAVAVVTIFLWGINNQRDETAGQQTAATEAAPPAQESKLQGEQSPQTQQQAGQQHQGSGNAPTTTGQGGNDQHNTQPADNADQKRSQSPTDAGQNGSPAANSGQPAQPGAGGR